MNESCATCSRFLKCTRPEKGSVCSEFKAWTDKQLEVLTSALGENVNIEQDLKKISDEYEQEVESELQEKLHSAFAPSSVIAPDLKIDDSDLKEYPNFYEFCMDPDGLNQPPLARQLVIFTHMFAEWCPHCTHEMFHDIEEFPVDYPVENAKEHVTFLEHGVCPKCGSRKSEMIKNGDLNGYMELSLCCGQRSGKSIGTSLANAYVEHKFLKLQSPTKAYNLTSNTSLAGTFVGLTFGRAKSLLFEPLVDLMSTSPWFQQYHELLDHYKEVYNDDTLYTFGKEMIIYKHRSMKLYPASPNKRILRGDTRFLSAIDELGWFPFGEESNERERAGADEVYEALDRSMLTVREAYEKRIEKGHDNIPTAYGIYASSPSAYNDKIMSLVRSFKGSDIALGAHFPTWEMNPHISRNSRAIRKAYLENPVKAERDYGANPPLADSAFIADPTEFQNNFTNKPNLLGKYKYTIVSRKSGMERRAAAFKAPLRTVKGPCVLGIDAGSSNNSFGISLARLSEDGKRPQVIGMMEIAPAHGKPLDHAHIYKSIILPVIKQYQVVRVYVDRWQSLKIIHDIEMDTKDLPYEVRGVEYSMRLDDFEFVLDFMRDPDYTPQLPKLESDWDEVFTRNTEGYPHCFKSQPVSHFLFQMATVRETRKNVDKGTGYTDDVFRSTMICLTNLYEDDVVQELKNYKFESSTGPKKALITSIGYSGGGSSNLHSGGGSTSSKSIVVQSRLPFN